jgi:hypothetical protein
MGNKSSVVSETPNRADNAAKRASSNKNLNVHEANPDIKIHVIFHHLIDRDEFINTIHLFQLLFSVLSQHIR